MKLITLSNLKRKMKVRNLKHLKGQERKKMKVNRVRHQRNLSKALRKALFL